MKKTITLLMLFIASFANSQIVVDTLANPLDSLHFINNNGVVTPDGTLFYDNTTHYVTATLLMNVNMSDTIPGANAGIDSINVSYSFNTSGGNFATTTLKYTGIADTTYYSGLGWLKNESITQTNGLISFTMTIGFGASSVSYIHFTNFRVIAYSRNTTTTGIKQLKNSLNIFTYNDVIKTDNVLPNSTIKVFNSLGQIVFESILKDEIQTNLQTGIYTIQVFNNNEIIETKKCVLINNQ
jgi:hypothetical protein